MYRSTAAELENEFPPLDAVANTMSTPRKQSIDRPVSTTTKLQRSTSVKRVKSEEDDSDVIDSIRERWGDRIKPRVKVTPRVARRYEASLNSDSETEFPPEESPTPKSTTQRPPLSPLSPAKPSDLPAEVDLVAFSPWIKFIGTDSFPYVSVGLRRSRQPEGRISRCLNSVTSGPLEALDRYLLCYPRSIRANIFRLQPHGIRPILPPAEKDRAYKLAESLVDNRPLHTLGILSQIASLFFLLLAIYLLAFKPSALAKLGNFPLTQLSPLFTRVYTSSRPYLTALSASPFVATLSSYASLSASSLFSYFTILWLSMRNIVSVILTTVSNTIPPLLASSTFFASLLPPIRHVWAALFNQTSSIFSSAIHSLNNFLHTTCPTITSCWRSALTSVSPTTLSSSLSAIYTPLSALTSFLLCVVSPLTTAYSFAIILSIFFAVTLARWGFIITRTIKQTTLELRTVEAF